MDAGGKTEGLDRFLAIGEHKRDRIVNAAMKEFRYGYKRASTDTIVKDAGISKGLLFHYFGTKKALYEYLVRFAMDTIQKDFFDMINLGQRDIIESIWQQVLLRRDISDKYSNIYDFMMAVHTEAKDSGTSVADASVMYARRSAEYIKDAYEHCDTTLFREDVDPHKAIGLIIWGVNGFFEDAERKTINRDGAETDDYEAFLTELRGYLDTFRLCFYKHAPEFRGYYD